MSGPRCLQAAPSGSGVSFASTCERLAAPLRQAVSMQRSAWQPQWPSARPTLQRWALTAGLPSHCHIAALCSITCRRCAAKVCFDLQLSCAPASVCSKTAIGVMASSAIV